ncbi:MAG: DUF2314 domain-containing protein [Myxococcales bacterium]|nr:DUF2314 domain-containing protein [Myxococcales bacterium]
MRAAVVVVVTLSLVATAGCRRSADRRASSRAIAARDASAATPAAPIAPTGIRTVGARPAAGSVRAAQVTDAYAIVLPPRADLAAVERAMRAVATARGLDAEFRPMTVAEIGVTAQSMRYFARGFDDAETAALLAAPRALGVMVGGDATRVGDLVAGTAAVARAGGAAARGWIVDPNTRETFTRAAFDERRPEPLPQASTNMVVVDHVADDAGGLFLESAGLARFGLPELYLGGVPPWFPEAANEMFNAAAQELIERGALPRDTLTTPPWPENARALRDHGGTGRVTFDVTWSLGDEADDPDAEPMLELTLPGGPFAERISAARRAFFGLEADKLLSGDPAKLEAARARALVALAALAPRFARGVPDLEALHVKAPFTTDHGGIEWMWVEVRTWQGQRITGILSNQPDDIAALKEGAEVEVRQDELFDYVHQRADGTTAGGETNRILAGED